MVTRCGLLSIQTVESGCVNCSAGPEVLSPKNDKVIRSGLPNGKSARKSMHSVGAFSVTHKRSRYGVRGKHRASNIQKAPRFLERDFGPALRDSYLPVVPELSHLSFKNVALPSNPAPASVLLFRTIVPCHVSAGFPARTASMP